MSSSSSADRSRLYLLVSLWRSDWMPFEVLAVTTPPIFATNTLSRSSSRFSENGGILLLLKYARLSCRSISRVPISSSRMEQPMTHVLGCILAVFFVSVIGSLWRCASSRNAKGISTWWIKQTSWSSGVTSLSNCPYNSACHSFDASIMYLKLGDMALFSPGILRDAVQVRSELNELSWRQSKRCLLGL